MVPVSSLLFANPAQRVFHGACAPHILRVMAQILGRSDGPSFSDGNARTMAVKQVWTACVWKMRRSSFFKLKTISRHAAAKTLVGYEVLSGCLQDQLHALLRMQLSGIPDVGGMSGRSCAARAMEPAMVRIKTQFQTGGITCIVSPSEVPSPGPSQ